MCFTIRPKDKAAKIAEKDINCLKILRLIGSSLHSPANASLKTIWKVDKVRTVKTLKRLATRLGEIEEGLHAKKSFRSTIEWTRFHPATHVYKAIIPAGSIYWENNTEYVSDSMKIISKEPIKTKYEANKYSKS